MVTTPAEFIAKWKNARVTERQGAQSHFIDLCHLFRHPTPMDVDKVGQDFTFERLVAMPEKRGKKAHGWADVYKKNFFAWEYKKPGVDLDKAYDQLKLYKDELQNPPLLIVSDLTSFRIHTNFTNAPRETRSFQIESLLEPVIYQQLYNVFWEPEALRPQETVEKITQKTAGQLARIAHLAIKRNEIYAQENGLSTEGIAESVARYLDRIVFCLFAEDIGLLEDKVFTKMVQLHGHSPQLFASRTAELFQKMSAGGFFGITSIPHFNGSLFVDEPVIELSAREIEAVRDAAKLDWKDVDPSIFGTLFEHGLKMDERSLLGAHYTGRIDIQTLVEPVILDPLRREWHQIQAALEQIENEIDAGDQTKDAGRYEQAVWLEKWFSRLEGVRVLDPACGSGNFLSVTLGALLDLEKVALNWAADAEVRSLDGTPFHTRVRPEMMLGIEVNPYAQDLARTVVQITYLQWLHANGYPRPKEPILRHTDNIWHHDALFDFHTGIETQWPDAEFIIGNPPFLGASKIWSELGRPYQKKLWGIFEDRVPGAADLCCYWFDKAIRHINSGHATRAGLVGTQAIRGGANRVVLGTIRDLGNIFFAISDRDWGLEGANVHISLVGFDDGSQERCLLDGEPVDRIFANLTSKVDVTLSRPLAESLNHAFYGSQQKASFDIEQERALIMLQQPNPHGRPNSDILKPSMNGTQLLRGGKNTWVIDYGFEDDLQKVELYETPFMYIEQVVKPERMARNETRQQRYWWLHARPSPRYREVLTKLPRYIVTAAVSKHHIMVWMDDSVLVDHALIVFAYADDYSFGVLQSKIHEVWALRQGTRLEDRPRYTPTTCFDTFPFPSATERQKQSIAEAAINLNILRNNWLRPEQWMSKEIVEFPASENGPWHRHLIPDTLNEHGIGMAQWTRIVPTDPKASVHDIRFDPRINDFRTHHVTTKDALSHRNLTNLYNHPPKWLKSAHEALNSAVFAAYGWPSDIDDEEVLDRLLTLNLKRADVPSG